MSTATLEIRQQYHYWGSQLETRQPCEVEFEKWLFLQVAPVLFGQKAGELLTLMVGQFGLCLAQQLAYLDAVTALWSVPYLVLHETGSSTKFVLYQPEMVQHQLDAVPPCILQDELGYPVNLTAADFLKLVQRRWRETGKIPHEIGFALGYPIKDVLGYMGLQALPCSGNCGWQVYGEFAPSHRLCQVFMHARQEAIRLLYQPGIESHPPDTAVRSAPPTCSCNRCIDRRQ